MHLTLMMTSAQIVKNQQSFLGLELTQVITDTSPTYDATSMLKPLVHLTHLYPSDYTDSQACEKG